jgi:hypothetical protein
LRLSSQQKLIPRDISEAMGKLPPQDLELEEAVLGAILLEKPALLAVPFLKPSHFYLDAHKIIFEAVLELVRANEPQDMRTVVHQLRRMGKLDLLPEGAFYIANLTSKVSSAANIEYHARIVVEMAMKRELITIASRIHHDAYEGDTDVLELFQKVQEELKFLWENETASSGPEKIKLLWEQTLISAKPDEQPPLIYLDQTPVCTPGNHTLLIGKKKSRKSLLVTYLLYLFLKLRDNLGDNVAVFDTEQGKLHVWKGRDRLYRMTNQNAAFFWLRGKSPRERREFISQTVANWSQRSSVPLKILVIDGIRDCMSNINDPDETTEVLVWLEQLTINYNLSIINILHINKTDGNARGHIGSELLNKAECTIEVSYDEKTTNSIVKCESSREKPFDTFAFTHGPTGLPEIIGVPAGATQDTQDQIEKLQKAFEGETLRYKELLEQIEIHFDMGEVTAKKQIQKFVNRGWIMKSGKERSTSRYQLMVQPGQELPRLIPLPRAEPDLFHAPPPETTSDDLPF